MTKFKVGDKVRLIEKPNYKNMKGYGGYVKSMSLLKKGDIGTITSIYNYDVKVRYDIGELWYNPSLFDIVVDNHWLSPDAWGDCYDWSKAESGMYLERKTKHGFALYIFEELTPNYLHAKECVKQNSGCYGEIISFRPHFYADRKRMWKEKVKEYTLQELVGKEVVSAYEKITVYKIEFLTSKKSFILTNKVGTSIVYSEHMQSEFTFADGSPIRIKHD